MNSSARQIVSATKSRLYSAAAAAKSSNPQANSLSKHNAQISRLKNGVLVASVENYSPLSFITVLYNGGARYETPENRGITHCLRDATNLTSEKASTFAFIRNLQQIGGQVVASTTREQASITLTCTRDKIGTGVQFLGNATSRPLYYRWELSDIKPFIQHDLAVLGTRPDIQLIEALHAAAYRQIGLGNSLYMDETLVGKHNTAMLKSFHDSHVVSGNVALVGVGVDHAALVTAAKEPFMDIAEGSATKPVASKYIGGELRHDVPSMDLVYAAVVREGASIGSADAAALSVLQAILGPVSNIAYSTGLAVSKLSDAAHKATSDSVAAACININYSDSGLFGYSVVAPPKDARQVITAVNEKFAAAGEVTDADVQVGKVRALANLYMNAESSHNEIEGLASSVLLTGEAANVEQQAANIEAVKLADIQKIAKRLLSSKPTLAAIGDLHNTSYVDEL